MKQARSEISDIVKIGLMRRLVFAAFALVLLRGDMYPDASNAKLPEAQYYLGIVSTPSVMAYGAKGDCVTDDTTAIQSAINSNPGRVVWVPKPANCYKISAPITLSNGQTISGEGSSIQQTSSLAAVITATGTGAVVENLALRAGGGRVSQIDGSGVLLSNCTHCKVRGNTITNHRGGGVTVTNSNENEITGNTFLNASVSGATHEVDVGWDVQVLNSSSRNLVSGNLCISGTGAGVKVQSVNDGEIAEDNVITGNRIANTLIYGIIVYRNYNGSPPAPQSVKRTVVANNNIENVAGTMLNTATGDYAYGAGIYIQGAEDAVVTGNSINRAHSGAVVFSSSLAPGGIGVANMSRGTITGNSITNSGVNGIDISNAFPSKADPDGALAITGNTILNSTLRGIRLRNSDNISMTDNIIAVAGSSGIEANLTLTFPMKNYVISSNRISSVGASGINLKYVSNAQVVGNLIEGLVGTGIGTEQGTDITIANNLVKNHGGVGIVVDSTVLGASVLVNSIIGNGTSAEGIRLDAVAMLGQNRVSGNVQNWTGNYAVLRGTSSTVAVGNIGTGEDNLDSYVLPAASMVRQGDNLHVTAWGDTLNNANVKTLKVYFGSALIGSAVLTPSQFSNWSVDLNCLHGPNANSQRCVVQLVQGGTVTQSSVTQTTTSENQGAAITVRFTGTATNDNDIRQLGIITTFSNG